MARNTIPGYCRQRGKQDRAFVDLDGSRFYLGLYGSEESKAEYTRVLAEWRSGSRQAPVEKDAITCVELAARFYAWAQGYYLRPDGKPTRELGNYRATLRPLKALYGDTLAKASGPER